MHTQSGLGTWTIDRVAVGKRPADASVAARRYLPFLTLVVPVAAVFGPYTQYPGLRVEHIAVYGSVAVGTVAGVWMRVRPSRAGQYVLLVMSIQLLTAAVGLMAPPRNLTGIPLGNPAAGLDSLLLPMASLVLGWMLATHAAPTARLVRTLCFVLVAMMCLNALVSALSLTTNLAPLLSPFWDNQNVGATVAVNAAQHGRFTGVFNQPSEAGVLYSVALLAALYLFRDRLGVFALVAALLTVGGVLTISKVFLLVGLPVALWQIVRTAQARARRIAVLGALLGLAVAAAQYGLLPAWAGVRGLTRFLHPFSADNGVVGLYTAGRFGDSASLKVIILEVMDTSPWFGMGASGLARPYDNGWIEAFVVAGLVGVFCYTAALVAPAVVWWQRRRQFEPGESTLIWGVLLVAFGGSMGLPVLTANRVSSILWMLLGLALLSARREHAPQPQAVPR